MKSQYFGSLGIALSLLGCGSNASNEGSATDTDWQPVVGKSYPYVGEFGETVCSESERYEGGRHLVMAEFYHFSVMNEALQGRGPLAPDVLAAVHAAGIDRVETCQDARDLLLAQQNFVEAGANQAAAARAGVVEAANPETTNPMDVVDKVANGRNSTVPSVVRVQPWNNGKFATCTGVLIGPRVLLTANHCFSAEGNWDVRVDRGRGSNGASDSVECLSGGNSCLNTPSGLNAKVFKFPGFLGKTDTARDLAIVINNANWGAGTSFGLDFLPITETRPGGGTSYWVDGFGAHESSGVGMGIHWLANKAQGIDTSLEGYWRDEVQQGVGRPCQGDSGSPAINTDKIPGGLFGPDLAIGLMSNGDGITDAEKCPAPGAFFRYTRIEDKLWFIDQTLTNNGLRACSRLSSGWAYRYCGL